ncbi:MAG: endonuclease MutS2 [Spirochaetaceae bacterium]|jgi:DNA mismatch repair protein MutS2|nr:endonuclease MutS2 [Spirochaetaceae bacterium]
MDDRTLHILDYYRIRDAIAGCCMSEEGAARLRERLPLTDIEEISRLKALGSQWTALIQSGKPSSVQGWPPVSGFFPVLRVEGTALSAEELFSLGLFCRSVSGLRSVLLRTTEGQRGGITEPDISLLAEEAATLPDLAAAEAAIFRVLDSSGQMRDLPELRAIRESIARIRRDIDALVRRYTVDDSLRSALQSDVPALRNGRQVLAVRSGFRGRIKGIVHEVSRTGQTLYVEPEDVVARNNDLVQEERRLSIEIQRILRELTAQLKPMGTELASAHEKMVFLDMIYAAARWGIRHSAVFAAQGPFRLVQARHPLLGEQAVPIDLQLLPDCRALIITGPNTGGKTVSLKTAALFALLNQSGFPVPAAEPTSFPVFDSVFADIGDEQSLDQSLSTFSGHMKNISGMLRSATGESLVLLDELGSGTDPLEGSAIAMAVLDSLLERGSLVFVTTHHGALKNYGYTHGGCVNASVDFDADTLSPTYRILMGIPGESHALDIAKRSGLDPAVAVRAESYLVNEQADVSALIRGLTEKHEQMILFEQERKAEQRYLAEQRRKADLKELRLRQKELELREQGYRKTGVFLDESRSFLENLVRELREGEITREKTLKVKEFLAGLAAEVDAEKESLRHAREELEELKQAERAEEAQKQAAALADASVGAADALGFVPGAEVKLAGFAGSAGRRGTLIREEKRGSWVVAVGDIRMTIKEREMTVVPSSLPKPSLSVDLSDRGGEDVPRFELDLRGMRFDEARKALERQLDLAAIKGLHEFSIIHGKGNGVLQQGVRDYLNAYPGIGEFHFARPEDGGSGKTIVQLRQ